jgi:hypothetical protein
MIQAKEEIQASVAERPSSVATVAAPAPPQPTGRPYQITVPTVVNSAEVAAWFGITKMKAYQLLMKMRAAGLKTVGVRGRYFSADVKKFAHKIG